MTRGGERPGGARAIALSWGAVDRWWFLLPLVGLGTLGAGALALFGLPPFELHGPLHHAGLMVPSCGMTRATRHLVRGDFSLALRYNPAVVVLPTFAAAVIARSIWGRATGRWLHVSVRRPWAVVAVVVLVVAALSINQQANVDLIGP